MISLFLCACACLSLSLVLSFSSFLSRSIHSAAFLSFALWLSITPLSPRVSSRTGLSLYMDERAWFMYSVCWCWCNCVYTTTSSWCVCFFVVAVLFYSFCIQAERHTWRAYYRFSFTSWIELPFFLVPVCHLIRSVPFCRRYVCSVCRCAQPYVPFFFFFLIFHNFFVPSIFACNAW